MVPVDTLVHQQSGLGWAPDERAARIAAMLRRVAWVCVFVLACSAGSSSRLPQPEPSSAAGSATTAGGKGGGITAERARTSGDGPPPPASSAPAEDPSCGHRGDPEPAPLVGITAAHNAIRCRLSRPSGDVVPPLSWSRALAVEAQRYADAIAADDCNLKHSTTELGENLFGGSGRYTAAEVVSKWAAEKRCFRYRTCPGCCTCTCGHYTQLVWGETERLGCGMASCADGSEVWVCNYDPAGNITGSAPY